MHHPFYPSPELPHHVLAYGQALHDHHGEYGDVPGNSANDLKPVVALAHKLQPMADEIERLQLELATKTNAYHDAAAPLWTAFSEKLDIAGVHAEKQGKSALENMLKNYRHHSGRHKQKLAAAAASAGGAGSTPAK